MQFQPEVMALITALIAIDFVLGIVKAVVAGDFSSKVMRQGLAHKMTYFVSIALAYIVSDLSTHLELGFEYAPAIIDLVYIWITVTEVSSILENIGEINPELTDNRFMNIFATVTRTNENKVDDEDGNDI